MKLDRVIWGILLLFIGGVLLLDNFNIIEFYWRNVWSFWPIFLIILGVNILFNKNNSQTGNIISLAILVITLSFLFVKGQERPSSRYWWGDGRRNHIEIDTDDDDRAYTNATFVEPMLAGDSAKKNILNVSGGGTSFDLKGATDSLFAANVRKKNSSFVLSKESSDSVNTITFKLQDKNKRNSWSFNDGGNDVDLRLNTSPIWEMNLKLGAGQIDFDLKDYKVRTLNFDGGAAEVDIKLGSLLPITDVNVKTGVADVKIRVPKDLVAASRPKPDYQPKILLALTKLKKVYTKHQTTNRLLKDLHQSRWWPKQL